MGHLEDLTARQGERIAGLEKDIQYITTDLLKANSETRSWRGKMEQKLDELISITNQVKASGIAISWVSGKLWALLCLAVTVGFGIAKILK